MNKAVQTMHVILVCHYLFEYVSYCYAVYTMFTIVISSTNIAITVLIV